MARREENAVVARRLTDVVKLLLRVTVDTELSYAKVYISVLGADGHEQEVVDGLNSAEGYIKSRLHYSNQ